MKSLKMFVSMFSDVGSASKCWQCNSMRKEVIVVPWIWTQSPSNWICCRRDLQSDFIVISVIFIKSYIIDTIESQLRVSIRFHVTFHAWESASIPMPLTLAKPLDASWTVVKACARQLPWKDPTFDTRHTCFFSCGLSLWCFIFWLHVKVLAYHNVVNLMWIIYIYIVICILCARSGPFRPHVCCAGHWVLSTEQVEMPISLVQRSATWRSGQIILSQPGANQSHTQTEDRWGHQDTPPG